MMVQEDLWMGMMENNIKALNLYLRSMREYNSIQSMGHFTIINSKKKVSFNAIKEYTFELFYSPCKGTNISIILCTIVRRSVGEDQDKENQAESEVTFMKLLYEFLRSDNFNMIIEDKYDTCKQISNIVN